MTGTTGPAPLLVVNADDYGLTEGVSRAILDAHRRGVVTSTSVLAPGPAFGRTVGWLRDEPGLGCGVHLAVVGEDPPLLSAGEIPTLVDSRGRLRPSWRAFLPLAAAGRIDPEDLRREFSAQFDAVVGAGVAVDHLDTHQNLHLWPPVADVVLELGDERGVRRIRSTRSTARGPVGLTVRRLGARLDAELRRRGWTTTAATTGLDQAGRLDLGAMVGALASLAATRASSAELATHPGLREDPARDRYRWGYLWGDEHEALCSATVRAAIGELGFRLGTFRDVDGPR